MKLVALLAVLVACGDNVAPGVDAGPSLTLGEAYRQVAAQVCANNLRCRRDVYLQEYGTSDLAPCVQNISAAALGSKDPARPASAELLAACVADLGALTCPEVIGEGQWPGACVALPN